MKAWTIRRNQGPFNYVGGRSLYTPGSQIQLIPCDCHKDSGIPSKPTSWGKASFLFLLATFWFSTRNCDTEFILHVFHLFPRNVNYITSWLSIMGPVVGLNLPLSYAKATSQDEWFVDKRGKEQSLGACFTVSDTDGVSLTLSYTSDLGASVHRLYWVWPWLGL